MDLGEIDYRRELVLIVDDEPYLRDILEQIMNTMGFQTFSASTAQEALVKMRELRFSLLLTDIKMPEMDGLELIPKVKEEFPDVRIIAMTGFADKYKYVDVINAGANDFIKKPFDIGELEAKVRRIFNERNLWRELERLTITDSLTGLYNQRHFYERLEDEVVRADRQGFPVSLILIDLDRFKDYNDTYGHLAGDEVLKRVGDTIRKHIRDRVDWGFRYGGDEFAVVVVDGDMETAREMGDRIKSVLKQVNGISASVGYSEFKKGRSAKDLVAEADRDLYRTKGENR